MYARTVASSPCDAHTSADTRSSAARLTRHQPRKRLHRIDPQHDRDRPPTKRQRRQSRQKRPDRHRNRPGTSTPDTSAEKSTCPPAPACRVHHRANQQHRHHHADQLQPFAPATRTHPSPKTPTPIAIAPNAIDPATITNPLIQSPGPCDSSTERNKKCSRDHDPHRQPQRRPPPLRPSPIFALVLRSTSPKAASPAPAARRSIQNKLPPP